MSVGFLLYGGGRNPPSNARRPRWGTWHFLQSKDFLALYPDVEKFCNVRDVLDPKKVFQNASLGWSAALTFALTIQWESQTQA